MRTRGVEAALLVIGFTLLAVWGGAWVQRAVSSRIAIRNFEASRAQYSRNASTTKNGETLHSKVDFSLWSAKRVDAYKASLAEGKDDPLALLLVPKIHLEVPVYNGTDALTLNRGVGRIPGTAQVGAEGNLGIAGHRDGFFRGLKDLAPGDTIELLRRSESDTYKVERIEIVKPNDVSILNPTRRPSLTLVTCYPFYYVGSAPKRFIVHASLTSTSLSRLHQEVHQSKPAAAK